MRNIRALNIINDTIKSLELNLNSFVVLTEVGSNNFIYTPIIPLLAGAKKVYAWTKDSSYGKSEDIVKKCLNIAKSLNLENRLDFSVNSVNFDHLKNADIITNSAFIRPINETILKYTKPNIAIPLMYEAWEIRDQDIDIESCTRNKVRVAGTWENHPKIEVFNYVKELTLKLIFEAGYEISGNKFIIWSNDHFGEKAKEVLKNNNADMVIVTTDYKILLSNIKNIDVVLLFDYHEKRDYFGPNGIFNLNELTQFKNHFGIVHLYGSVDVNYLREKNIQVYPNKSGKASKMTFTLAHVGLHPVIRLLTAGFKVGQETLQNKISEISQPINF